jgi:hypothetical protein
MSLELERSPAIGAQPTLAEQAPVLAAAPGEGTIRKRFVILTTPRSGSSHLVALMNSHPQMCCLGELFNPKGTVLRELGMKNRQAMTQAGQTPLQFLDRIVSQLEERGQACKPVFGFKMKLHHDPRMIDHVIDDPRWSVIVLERGDLMGQWTSMELAKQSGRWDTGRGKGKKKRQAGSHDVDEAEEDDEDDAAIDAEAAAAPPSATAAKVTFDPWKFEQYCFRMRAKYASIYHRLGERKYFRLFTEEMDANLSGLLEFLGVDPGPIGSARPRQNSSSMRDRIENYDAYARYAQRHSMPVS